MKCGYVGKVLCVLGLGLASMVTQAAETVTVFAASSLTNALNEVAALYEKQAGVKARISYASSSTLARQIAQGAPADIYLSANERWMDYLQEIDTIQPKTRQSLLENHLVVVAPNDYPKDHIEVTADWDLDQALEGTRLAVGDPNHVPAGLYTKESFESLGLWQQALPLLAQANNVRSALLLVERKEAMLGVVYKTDAMISKKVKIVSELPDNSHSPISYPVAIVKDRDIDTVLGFYHFMLSKQAAEVFARYGFGEAH